MSMRDYSITFPLMREKLLHFDRWLKSTTKPQEVIE